ncbi:MAG TPA: DUF2975 domain-containing protein [Steroidobacteraceae bacterium]|nr:DUF2975 domain-containing protein [Steroidobacteraceae bacterium]
MQYLGPQSVSSGLSSALSVAKVIVAVWFAFAVIGGLIVVVMAIAQTHQPPLALHTLKFPMGLGLTSWTVAVPFVVFEVVAARGAIGIVRRLKTVFGSFVANQPFARDNADHLRRIWVTLVVIEIVRISAFVVAMLLTTVYGGGARLPLPDAIAEPIDLSRLFLIFVVLVLGEVFRRGTLLAAESELTV